MIYCKLRFAFYCGNAFQLVYSHSTQVETDNSDGTQQQ